MLLNENKQELSYFLSLVLSAGKCKLYQREKNVRFPFAAFPLLMLSIGKCGLVIKQFSKGQGDSSRFPWAELFPLWYLLRTPWHGYCPTGEHAALLMPAFNYPRCVHLLPSYAILTGEKLEQRTVHFLSYPDAIIEERSAGHKSIVGKQDIVCES